MCCNGAKQTVQKAQKIATGFAYLAMGINEELSARRRRICNNCPHLSGGIACGICGCAIDAKTRLPLEECPDPKNKRWTAEAV